MKLGVFLKSVFVFVDGSCGFLLVCSLFVDAACPIVEAVSMPS
jgi:hypothetical protein